MKNKITAGLLALFLGGIGIHRFYLGQNGLGILCILFSWTLIPFVLGVIDACVFFIQSDKAFGMKYNYGAFIAGACPNRISIHEVTRYQHEYNAIKNATPRRSRMGTWNYTHTLG
ncbi:TM2 domain-containing protein [Telluribacter sp. SYSU D00476]|uniref:TM2 domain-containing protein n=1 Tax=Telluribacter sp. SYSU D00476 TaxID=2811430 RepID=UPI001FF6C536|nr:TM2 domain-containing protein [Telluribacter sp. SYSU D00476]